MKRFDTQITRGRNAWQQIHVGVLYERKEKRKKKKERKFSSHFPDSPRELFKT